MLESEAKTKWCPFARTVSLNGERPHNRIMKMDPREDDDPIEVLVGMCIGSACMAWERTSKPPEDSPMTKPTGYCGIARATY